MLDLLALAPDFPRARSKDRQIPTKEERFNLLLDKLRERNQLNDAFIKKFLQKANKKKVKFPTIPVRMNSQGPENESEQREENQEKDLFEKPEGRDELEMEEYKRIIRHTCKEDYSPRKSTIKQNILKETNHTLTADLSDDQDKTLSFPNLDFCSQEADDLPCQRPRPAYQNLKQDKQFNKYLRNVFFKEMASKIEAKKAAAEHEQGQARRSVNRIKTEMNSKYQLSIKSLVFGHQDASPQGKAIRSENSDKQRRVEGALDRFRNVERYEKDYQFHDEKMSSKGMLPIIHNHQLTKNKRFLENYIKYNNQQDRPCQQPEIRTISLTSESTQMGIKKEFSNRVGMSLRIQTINIQKA